MRYLVCAICVVVLLGYGCERSNDDHVVVSETDLSEISSIDATNISQDDNSILSGIKLHMITSDHFYYAEQEKEVLPALKSFVNSGQHEIVKIRTIYSEGYLLSAEVYYKDK